MCIYYILVIPKAQSVIDAQSVIMAILITLLLMVAIMASVYYYRKKTHDRVPVITSERNDLHESKEHENKVDEESILPNWLRVRPDMIYPHSCIEKRQQLGQGQFGCVFKGVLIQGKAVYVIK